MTLPENRKPEALETNEPVVMAGAIIERTGKRRIQVLDGTGRVLVIATNGRTIHTRWENEE